MKVTDQISEKEKSLCVVLDLNFLHYQNMILTLFPPLSWKICNSFLGYFCCRFADQSHGNFTSHNTYICAEISWFYLCFMHSRHDYCWVCLFIIPSLFPASVKLDCVWFLHCLKELRSQRIIKKTESYYDKLRRWSNLTLSCSYERRSDQIRSVQFSSVQRLSFLNDVIS